MHPTAAWEKVILKEAQWFYVDPVAACNYLKVIHKDYKVFLEDSRKQPNHVKKNFSLEKAHEVYRDTFDKYVPAFPEPVQLKLPKLEKI